MPPEITPMTAVPVDQAPRGEDWLFEIKWDGVRAICFLEGESIRLVSRNGIHCERQYPELTVIHHYIAADRAILDGEIAVLDDKGVSRFELIQSRISNSDSNAVAHLARSRPAVLLAFDLLYLDGYDLRQVALIERRRVLESILTETPVLRYSAHFAGAGEQMLEAARQAGLEGVIAKHAHSRYEPKRSREWRKLKVVSEQEFLICGFTAGERDYFGALVLGVYDRGKLVWAGNVGTGFDQKIMAGLHLRMQPLIVAHPPFALAPKMPRGVTWVKPELVCMIRFSNWTTDNKLRHPVYLGLRTDKTPSEVTRERPEPGDEPETRARRKGPLLPAKADEAAETIDGHPVKLTNLGKVFYPGEGYTKRDILNYYDAVSDLILPQMK